MSRPQRLLPQKRPLAALALDPAGVPGLSAPGPPGRAGTIDRQGPSGREKNHRTVVSELLPVGDSVRGSWAQESRCVSLCP